MLRFLFGTFMLLHGLVHLWYVTLSREWVAFQPEMGWTGESWLFSSLLSDSATRALASVCYLVATLLFVAGGVGVYAQQDWWRPLAVVASAFSAVIIILFWDGGTQLLVEKGLLGLLINVLLLFALLVFKWPATQF